MLFDNPALSYKCVLIFLSGLILFILNSKFVVITGNLCIGRGCESPVGGSGRPGQPGQPDTARQGTAGHNTPRYRQVSAVIARYSQAGNSRLYYSTPQTGQYCHSQIQPGREQPVILLHTTDRSVLS